MGRRDKGEFFVQALAEVARAPWWVGVGFAVLSFLTFSWIANWGVAPGSSGGFSTAIVGAAIGLSSAFRWLVPLLLLLAVSVGFGRRPSHGSSSRPRMKQAFQRYEVANERDGRWDKPPGAEPDPQARAEAVRPEGWSEEVLSKLEWKRLELLAANYYEHLGFRVETVRFGADGGIDAKLFRGDAPSPAAILQCKAWSSSKVGVKPVRELLGVMTHQRVYAGVFLTTSTYTKYAVAFALTSKIALVDGGEFLEKIRALPVDVQRQLLNAACAGDWTTPSCPSCGAKKVRREGKHGPFWGCPSFPKCRHTFQIRQARLSGRTTWRSS